MSVCSIIPMGPACMSAGILDMAGFRSCSYALDWGRSGSLLLHDLFALESDELYWLHFHEPNIKYEQVGKLSSEVRTVEIQPQKLLYGYPYYYNPHRPVGLSKDYHIRCINRFKSVIASSSISKLFFFVQRLDKPCETYFPDIANASKFLSSTFSKFVHGEWSAIICSFYASASNLPIVQKDDVDANIRHVQLGYPSLLGDDAYHPYVVSACFPTSFRKCHELYAPNRTNQTYEGKAALNCFRPSAY